MKPNYEIERMFKLAQFWELVASILLRLTIAVFLFMGAVFLCFVLFINIVHAQEAPPAPVSQYYTTLWEPSQYLEEAALQVLTYEDYSQTQRAVGQPKYHELNPLLGRHPSHSRVRGYFVASDAGFLVLDNLLPTKYRTGVLGAQLFLEGAVVHHNVQVGFSWRW